MKILHILYELKFSGAEIMYVDAAPLFQNRGCTLAVMSTASTPGEYAPYFRQAGFIVVHNPYPRGWNIRTRFTYYKQLVDFLKRGNFDIVHIHVNAFMWALAFCTWVAGKRPVYTFHSVFPSHFYSYLYHVLQRWSAKYIFGCRFQSISDTVYAHELNYYHNKTKNVYNWYGTNRFYPSLLGEKSGVREELGIPMDTLVLISIGGCSENKRHSEIIKALAFITKKIPSVIYLHLGEGDVETEEKELAAALGVYSLVRFYGNQRDVRKFLVASDIYLMTSKFEGISVTTIEAMACGIPAILYDVAGLRDFNRTGENSCLIPEDHQILAEKVIELYSNSDLSGRLTSNARELVNTSYCMEKNASEIFTIYHQ